MKSFDEVNLLDRLLRPVAAVEVGRDIEPTSPPKRPAAYAERGRCYSLGAVVETVGQVERPAGVASRPRSASAQSLWPSISGVRFEDRGDARVFGRRRGGRSICRREQRDRNDSGSLRSHSRRSRVPYLHAKQFQRLRMLRHATLCLVRFAAAACSGAGGEGAQAHQDTDEAAIRSLERTESDPWFSPGAGHSSWQFVTEIERMHRLSSCRCAGHMSRPDLTPRRTSR